MQNWQKCDKQADLVGTSVPEPAQEPGVSLATFYRAKDAPRVTKIRLWACFGV